MIDSGRIQGVGGRIASNLSNRVFYFIAPSEIYLQLLFRLKPDCLQTPRALQGYRDKIEYHRALFLVLI